MNTIQSKKGTMVEVCVNVFSGFIVAAAAWQWLLIPLIERGMLSHTDTIVITTLFTVVSIVRSYFWRRYFNNRLHKMLTKRGYFDED